LPLLLLLAVFQVTAQVNATTINRYDEVAKHPIPSTVTMLAFAQYLCDVPY